MSMSTSSMISPRGPIVILISSMGLAVPILLSSSLYTLTCVILIIVGSLSTGYDVLCNVIPEIATYWCRDIILDDLLNQIFSLDGGSSMVGAYFSTMFLYAMPFISKEDRLKLMEPLFPDVKDIFFTPGGILRLLLPQAATMTATAVPTPSYFQSRFAMSPSHENKWNNVMNLSEGISSHRLLPSDLEWEENEDDDMISDTEISSDSIPSTTAETHFGYNHTHTPAAHQSTPTTTTTPPDITQILLQMIQHKLSKTFNPNNKNIQKYISYLKIVSSISLLLHTSTNKSARRIVSYATHTSIITTLLTIIAASQAIQTTQKIIFPQQIPSNTDNSAPFTVTTTSQNYMTSKSILSWMKKLPFLLIGTNSNDPSFRRRRFQKTLLVGALFYVSKQRFLRNRKNLNSFSYR